MCIRDRRTVLIFKEGLFKRDEDGGGAQGGEMGAGSSYAKGGGATGGLHDNRAEVMRDFVGMEDVDEATQHALIDFSYHLTIGNMDEVCSLAREPSYACSSEFTGFPDFVPLHPSPARPRRTARSS